MDIETTGVKKYIFQDLVCIYLLLNIQHIENIEFFVEPENSEDAKITIDDLNGINEIEIQVKGSQDTVTQANLAQYLAHFPKGKAENCLFDRLMTNPNLLVVFTMTGRCNDSTSNYLSSLENFYQIHRKDRIKLSDARILLNEFSLIKADSNTPTQLEINRANYINKINERYKIRRVREALTRLIIIEQITTENILILCSNLLRSKYLIPDDKHQSVIDRLKTVIFDGKDSKENIVDIFRVELSNFIPENIYPIDYIKHGIEDNLKKVLAKENALLITGSPRIGKTYISRWIAAEYAQLGFDIKETSDVAEALRFITDPTNFKRLVLIDDPFGATHSLQNVSNAFQQFEALLNRLSSNRKLIVAQVQDRLLEVTSQDNVNEVKSGAHQWLNLNYIESDFSNNLWLSLCNKYNIQKHLKEFVSNSLTKNELSLEAGCLEYLAIHHTELKGNYSLEKIKRLAHNNSKNLADALDHEGYTAILRTLAVTTNNNIDISLTDLTYILYNKNIEEYLSISDYLGTSFSFSQPNTISHKDKIITKYDPENNLLEADDLLLEKLEYRQIIKCKNVNNFGFTHPFYRSAAEHLISKIIRRREYEIINIINKGLFCLSPKTSRATARNLDWIYYGLKESNSRSELVKLAIKSLKSSYPSTRDIAFNFLVNNYSNLPSDIEKEINNWGYKISNSDLLDNATWINGEPIYPMGHGLTLETSSLSYFSSQTYTPELDPFLTENSKTTPEEAWKFLNIIKNSPEKLSFYTISKLLSYDEAIIRANAIKIWLEIPRENDNSLLEQVFLEIHPAIAKNILKSILRVWHTCSDERKDLLLNGLIKLGAHPVNAYIMFEYLIIFNRDNKIKNHPWDIFGALLPILLDSLSKYSYTSDHRLYDIVNTATKYLEKSKLLVIINSWLNWLEKKIEVGLPTDYAFGVTTLLIEITLEQPKLRSDIINRLLKLSGTGSIVRIIYDLVEKWNHLTQQEKELIFKKLQEERIDIYWIQAAALVQNVVPIELQQLLLPKDIILDNAESLFTLKEKNHELFLATIQMYLGTPEPLGYLGVHHRGKNYWQPIIEKITQHSSHPLFKKAWDSIYSSGNDDYVVPFINQLDSKDIENVLEILFEIKINTNDEFMPKSWDTIFSRIRNPKIRSNWIERLALNSASILNNFSELDTWILSSEIKSEFFKNLKNDMDLLLMSYNLLNHLEKFHKDNLSTEHSTQITEKALDNELRNYMTNILINLFRDHPPIHHSTCEILKDRIAKIGAENIILEEIKNYRLDLFEKIKVRKTKDSYIEKIKNWNN